MVEFVRARHDVSCNARREFIDAVESEFTARRLEWKDLWQETTLDRRLQMLYEMFMRYANVIYAEWNF